MAKILVTGCAGFIGSHTVEKLLSAGHTVCGVDNLRTGKLENLASVWGNPLFEWYPGDITIDGFLAEIAQRTNPDALVHLAALVSTVEAELNPALNTLLNVTATQKVAEVARSAGITRVVFASSAAVYGEQTSLPIVEDAPKHPIGLYGAAKLASEQLLASAVNTGGFTAVCLRYFNVFGPRQTPHSSYSGVLSIFAACASNRVSLTIYGDGMQTRDFVPVTEVARANVLAATLPMQTVFQILNVCSGHEYSLLDLMRLIQVVQPDMPEPVFRPERPADIRRSLGSPQRAADLLGFSTNDPVVAIQQYLVNG